MEEIITSISEAIRLLVWFDWLTIAILLFFIGFGIKRGLIIEAANLSFLIIAIFIAWLFYEKLSNLEIIKWSLDSHQSQLAVSFGVIFIVILIVRKVIYKLMAISSEVERPCILNKPFVLLVFFIANILISWHYTSSFASFDPIKHLVINNALRIELSFILIFAIITSTILLLKYVLNISINPQESCHLKSFFKIILNGLHNVNIVLNAREINTVMSKIWVAIIGLFKGFTFIIIIVLVLQSNNFISKQYFWIASKNSLKNFQDVATNIKPELAKYLLFIKKTRK